MKPIRSGDKETIAQVGPKRTLAEVIQKLPIRELGCNPVIDIGPLPDDDLPTLEIDRVEDSHALVRPPRPKGTAK
jgi:hypothetical protein